MTWKKIAGRGELGNFNWGVDYDDKKSKKRLEPELLELKKHIGENILLTGGGGFGAYECKLVDAQIKEFINGGFRIKVELEDLDPPLANDSKFSPWIDSWQISVWVDD